MKKYDFTVFGCASSVCMLKVKELPQAGKTVWVQNPNAECFNGGVGFNICYNLSSLGAQVYPVLSYPDDRLDQLLHQSFCPRFNWPTTGLFPPPKGSYRTCYIFQDEYRDHMTVIYRYGENANQSFVEIPQTMQDDFFSNSKMVILASPRPASTEPILRALQKHHTSYVFSYRNDKIIFPKNLLWEILLGASLLFMNDAEAEEIIKQYSLNSITSLFDIGKASVITTTMGKKGSVVYSKEADGSICKISVPVTENQLGNIDAVGAGDAFLSGFMFGYSNGKSLETCAQYGSTMSSFIIEKEGSTTNSPCLEEMLARNKLRPDARDD